MRYAGGVGGTLSRLAHGSHPLYSVGENRFRCGEVQPNPARTAGAEVRTRAEREVTLFQEPGSRVGAVPEIQRCAVQPGETGGFRWGPAHPGKVLGQQAGEQTAIVGQPFEDGVEPFATVAQRGSVRQYTEVAGTVTDDLGNPSQVGGGSRTRDGHGGFQTREVPSLRC